MNTEPNQLGKANFEGYYKDYPEPVPYWPTVNQKNWQAGGEAAVKVFIAEVYRALRWTTIADEDSEKGIHALLSRLAAPMQGSPEVAPESEWEEAYGDVAKANGWRWQETEAKSMTGKWHPMDLMYPFQDGRLYRRLKRPASAPEPTSTSHIEPPAVGVEWKELPQGTKVEQGDQKRNAVSRYGEPIVWGEWKEVPEEDIGKTLMNDRVQLRRPIPRQPAGEVKDEPKQVFGVWIAAHNRFCCPKCGGSHFGSTLQKGDSFSLITARQCHDEFSKGCHWSGPYYFPSDLASLARRALDDQALLTTAHSQIEAHKAELAEARREVEELKKEVQSFVTLAYKLVPMADGMPGAYQRLGILGAEHKQYKSNAEYLAKELKVWEDKCNSITTRNQQAQETIRRLEKELGNRCEHCGAKLYSGPPDCPGCGAPNCCPQCCKILNLEDERDDLKKELTRLQSLVTWVDCKVRMPEEKDGDRNGCVEWLVKTGVKGTTVYSRFWQISEQASRINEYTHWRPTNLPPLPSPQDGRDEAMKAAWTKFCNENPTLTSPLHRVGFEAGYIASQGAGKEGKQS